MSTGRRSHAISEKDIIKKSREDVKIVNERLARITEEKKVFMHSQAQGVIVIAEAVTGCDSTANFGTMLDNIGNDSSIMFNDAKCKLRLLVQRNNKIWQVVDSDSHSLVQWTIPITSKDQKPLLASEILLWLACAGYSKDALQEAKKIIMGWE